jgi:hypothetical protein
VPVNTKQWEDPYWTSTIFVSAVKKEVLHGDITAWPYSYNRKYADVFNQHLFTAAMGQVLIGQATPAAAAKSMADQIAGLLK